MSIATNVLGGPFNGYSTKHTVNSFKTCDDASIRSILKRSWNTAQARGQINGYNRIVTPFRAVNNSGDFLVRQNYVCGGPNPASNGTRRPGLGRLYGRAQDTCDDKKVPAASCNPKFVADSSDYIRFKKQRAYNVNFNDVNFGGYNNSSQEALSRVR
jgi:hypothetical protein